MNDFPAEFQPVEKTVDATTRQQRTSTWLEFCLVVVQPAPLAFLLLHYSFRPQASVFPSFFTFKQPPPPPSSTMPNLLKDLVAMVSPQAKRPLQSPSTTNRLSPAKQNVASGPFADLAARRENASAGVTVEQQQEQAKMDAFVFFNVLR